MANKRSTATKGVAIAAASVTTAGSSGTGAVRIEFNDSDAMNEVIDLVEKAKAQIIGFYTKR